MRCRRAIASPSLLSFLQNLIRSKMVKGSSTRVSITAYEGKRRRRAGRGSRRRTERQGEERDRPRSHPLRLKQTAAENKGKTEKEDTCLSSATASPSCVPMRSPAAPSLDTIHFPRKTETIWSPQLAPVHAQKTSICSDILMENRRAA